MLNAQFSSLFSLLIDAILDHISQDKHMTLFLFLTLPQSMHESGYIYVVRTAFEPVDEILKYRHSNERHSAALSFGAVYVSIFCKIKILRFSVWNLGGFDSERFRSVRP